MNLPVLLLLAQTHPLAAIDTIVRDGIEAGVYPGAVVVVGTADSVLLARGYGRLTWSEEEPVPSPDSTLYDLASLTKVVATTAAIMLLVERGGLHIDDPVERHLAAFAGGGGAKSSVTVRDLLAHTSGLRAFLSLDTLTSTAGEARARVLSEPLRWPPGSRVEYSDLNAMVLGWVVEAVSGQGLDRFLAMDLYPALSMSETRFNVPRALHYRTAPINVWRGSPIRGVVHDQNAARLDGVAGHAGLYSTGMDLARYAQWHLRGGTAPDGEVLVSESIIDAFTTAERGSRALGWEVRDTSTAGSAGRLLSPAAFGHGGFTGTSIWVDRSTDVFVVFLTNRVYAPRTRRSISRLREVRGRLADASVLLRRHSCRVLAAAGIAGRC